MTKASIYRAKPNRLQSPLDRIGRAAQHAPLQVQLQVTDITNVYFANTRSEFLRNSQHSWQHYR